MSGRIFSVLLVLVVMVSAIGVIYAKHRNRMLYVELNRLQQQQDEINVDWGRLQLEQSTWATHGRVENVARSKLGMRNVDYGDVVIVKNE
jgi:cell division protein FtsL